MEYRNYLIIDELIVMKNIQKIMVMIELRFILAFVGLGESKLFYSDDYHSVSRMYP